MGQSRNASQRGTTWLSYVINVVSSCNWPQYTALCRQWGITNTGAVKLQASAYKESGIPLLFYISPCHEVTTSTPLFPFWQQGKKKNKLQTILFNFVLFSGVVFFRKLGLQDFLPFLLLSKRALENLGPLSRVRRLLGTGLPCRCSAFVLHEIRWLREKRGYPWVSAAKPCTVYGAASIWRFMEAPPGSLTSLERGHLTLYWPSGVQCLLSMGCGWSTSPVGSCWLLF